MSSRPGLNGDQLVLDSVPFIYPPAEGENGIPSSYPSGVKKQSNSELAEIEKLEKIAWQKGVQEAEARGRVLVEKLAGEQREIIEKILGEFSVARNEYFEHVETEVVHLALAIARKILHREAQIDPLLLTGLVHVALERFSAQTKIRLRVHPTQLDSWQKSFLGVASHLLPPELIGDESLAPPQCVIETEHGSTEVSLETHLKEIEQGFFDLLARRPRNP